MSFFGCHVLGSPFHLACWGYDAPATVDVEMLDGRKKRFLVFGLVWFATCTCFVTQSFSIVILTFCDGTHPHHTWLRGGCSQHISSLTLHLVAPRPNITAPGRCRPNSTRPFHEKCALNNPSACFLQAGFKDIIDTWQFEAHLQHMKARIYWALLAWMLRNQTCCDILRSTASNKRMKMTSEQRLPPSRFQKENNMLDVLQ